MRSSIAFLLIGIALSNSAYSQNVAVWDFTTRNGEENQRTRNFTSDFEEALVFYGGVTVLERRNLDRLAVIKNERAVQDVMQMLGSILDDLKLLRVEQVIFGEVFDDVESGETLITVVLQGLDGETVQIKSVLLRTGLTSDRRYRMDKMKELVEALSMNGSSAENSSASPVKSMLETRQHFSVNIVTPAQEGELNERVLAGRNYDMPPEEIIQVIESLFSEPLKQEMNEDFKSNSVSNSGPENNEVKKEIRETTASSVQSSHQDVSTEESVAVSTGRPVIEFGARAFSETSSLPIGKLSYQLENGDFHPVFITSGFLDRYRYIIESNYIPHDGESRGMLNKKNIARSRYSIRIYRAFEKQERSFLEVEIESEQRSNDNYAWVPLTHRISDIMLMKFFLLFEEKINLVDNER